MQLRRYVMTRISVVATFVTLLAFHSAKAAPRAEEGFLDLQSWSFADDGPVPLVGDWELYWGQLLDPSEFASEAPPSDAPPKPTDTLQVPGSWNDVAAAYGSRGGDGYATYRLRIRLPDEQTDDDLALYVPWLFTSYKLWVNGRPLAANGTVGTVPDDAVPLFLPLTVPVGDLSGVADIVIHVSNFFHRNGGVWNAPVLGTYPQLARRATWRHALNAGVSGAVLLMAAYHFVMYFVVRRWKEWLYLGLIAVIVAVRTLVTGDHLLGQIVGSLPWGFEIRAEYVTGYAFLFTFFGLLHTLFPQDVSHVIVRGSQAFGVFGAAVTLAAPVRLSSQLIPFSIWLALTLAGYCCFVMIKAWLRRRDGAGPMFWGGVALMVCLSHDMLRSNLIGFDIYLLPLGLTVLLLFQSHTVARRFAAALQHEAALATENAALLQTVRAQLEEVKRSRSLIAKLDQDVRRKIAERLHSSTQNRLLRAWHQLAAVTAMYKTNPTEAQSLIEQVRTDIEHIREVDIRQVSHELHPSIVRIGLLPAIESLVDQYEEIVPIRVEIDDAVHERDANLPGSIPEPIRLVVYRVLEECLGNILSHANASSVWIAVRMDESDTLTVIICDDGRGFDPQTVQPHLGLHAIAAAVSSVDGDWELDSAPGRGTRIAFRLPLGSKSLEEAL